MLTRACCCGGDAPTIGCSGGQVPTDACVTVTFQGTQGIASPYFNLAGSGTPGQLTGYSGYNTTYRYTYSSTLSTYPGVGTVSVSCNGTEPQCEPCTEWVGTGATMFLSLVCRPDGSIGVREIVLRAFASGAGLTCPGGSITGISPPNMIFRRFFPIPTSGVLNVPMANTNSAGNSEAIATGGTATVNVTAGPCSGLLASSRLRSADADAVARQVAALREPLTRQRRASGCRGCGDAGGDELL